VPGLVVIDTSCLWVFCLQKKHERLRTLLGDTARVTLEVDYEMRTNVPRVRHFQDLLEDPLWPERVALSQDQLVEVLQVAEDERRVLGGFTKQDLGEIATVVWARDTAGTAIVDDHLGRHLATLWGVQYKRGHHLIPAMVARGLLTSDEGWALWRRFLSQSTREEYEAACLGFTARNA
jgi:hypothetical protein